MKAFGLFLCFVTDIFCNSIIVELDNYRKEEFFTDVDIISTIDASMHKAHKIILSAFSSSYFKPIFKNGFKESHNNEIKLPYIKSSIETILNFIYSKKQKNYLKIYYHSKST